MSDHECNFWLTLAGTLVCNCGKSKHQPTAADAAETSNK